MWTAGPLDLDGLATMRDTRCHSSVAVIEKALTGHYRAEHLFVLEQALALYDVYQQKVAACDVQIESVLKELIPVPADQHWWAQSRKPMDMIRHGCSTSLFQASQQWSRMSS